MIRRNNKRLYESIMKDVAKAVKRHINESENKDDNDFYILNNAVNKFYEHLDSKKVKSYFKDEYDYDKILKTQNNINWNKIKSLLKPIINNLTRLYNWYPVEALLIEYIFYAYYMIQGELDILDYGLAEEEYPEEHEDFYNYGDVLIDITKSQTLSIRIKKLCQELPEELLNFIRDNLMDFFYDYNMLYNDKYKYSYGSLLNKK